jgi:hypothetical protein
MRTRIYGATAVAMLTGMTVIGAAPAALAGVDDQGRCSATSTWDSSLDLERGRWDLEFEVKTAKAGQRWKLTVKQNGSQVYSQSRRAMMEPDDDTPQAEAKWNIRRADHTNMRETFVLRATNLATGEVCKATLRE